MLVPLLYLMLLLVSDIFEKRRATTCKFVTLSL